MTKKRSKENAFQQSVLSVPSVQTTAFGSRVARCSQNHGHLKPSFSRIPTSPRFATSALGQDRWPTDQFGLTRICGGSRLRGHCDFRRGCSRRRIAFRDFSDVVLPKRLARHARPYSPKWSRRSRSPLTRKRRVRPAWSVRHRTCPRALVAKRGDVGIREKEGFKCRSF